MSMIHFFFHLPHHILCFLQQKHLADRFLWLLKSFLKSHFIPLNRESKVQDLPERTTINDYITVLSLC